MASPVNWNNVSMLTPGLKNLGNQFNAAFPNRDGTSDGAIGDYAHTQEKSGHNPDDTSANNAEWDGDSDNKSEVRAIDVDNNLNDSAVSMQDVIDHLRTLPNLGSVIRYMIYDHKQYHVDNDFNPTTYTGASPHTEHAHFSGARSDASDENTTFDFRLDEINMPTANEIASAVWNYQLTDPMSNTNPQGKKVAGTFLRYNDLVTVGAKDGVIDALEPDLEALQSAVTALKAQLDAISSKLDTLTGPQS